MTIASTATKLIVSYDLPDIAAEQILNFLQQKIGIKANRQTDELIIVDPQEKGSISIDQLRRLQKQLAHANYSADSQRYVVIVPAETMTQPAQNSLLKLLEEPPNQTQIILLSSQANGLLPTIHSRCQTFYFIDRRQRLDEALINDAQNLIGRSSPTEKLAIIDNYRQIENAKNLLRAVIIACRRHCDYPQAKLVKQIDLAQKAYRQLQNNCRPNLVLNNLINSFSQHKSISNKKSRF